MSLKIRFQLFVMMFIEYFIWGVWFVTMGTYLNNIGFNGVAIGNAYSTTCWAAIISPFFVGMIADRFFSSEKVLAVLHILGGILLYLASLIKTPGLFFAVLLLYTLCYMPTIALTNSVSFYQMKDSGKEFPGIRVLGTIGWIVAGLIVGFAKIEATNTTMHIGAIVSVLMGLYCLTLPHTPPKSIGKQVSVSDILGLESLKLMKDRNFAVFVICALLICIPLSFYYNFTNMFLNEIGVENAAGKMTLGQMSEVFFMLVMPFFFVRLGVKNMLIIGMLAWAARYLLFSFGNKDAAMWMLYTGIILHGVCYDFFFVTGFIYVDKKAPKEIQASAQGFITLVTYGVGMLIGAWISGWVVDIHKIIDSTEKLLGHNWKIIWQVPCFMAVIVIIGFALLFKEKRELPNKT